MNPAQYLSRVTFVVSFSLDKEIRYRVGDIERAFRSVVPSQATGTNVADSAASAIPRFTMSAGPKQILVSQVGAQLDMDFTDQRKQVDKLFPIVEKNCTHFWEGICVLKAIGEITEAGLVLTVNTPSKGNRAVLAEAISSRYFKTPNLGRIESASLQVGYLDSVSMFFSNVSVSTYEIREGLVHEPQAKAEAFSVDLSKLPVREIGIETKIDVNSRPMVEARKPMTTFIGRTLVDQVDNFVRHQGKEFLDWQI